MKKIIKDNGFGIWVISILMIISIIFICYIFSSDYDLYTIIINAGILILFFMFFIIIGICMWIAVIVNALKKEKEKILYLKNINSLVFIDEYLKVYRILNQDYKQALNEGTFYNVVTKGNEIIKINESVSNGFKLAQGHQKVGYWTNY